MVALMAISSHPKTSSGTSLKTKSGNRGMQSSDSNGKNKAKGLIKPHLKSDLPLDFHSCDSVHVF